MERYRPGTALLVVDVQNDFADPRGSLYVEGADRILEAVNAEVARAARRSCPVVYTQDWHPEVTPHFLKDGGTWPVHCVMDSWGAAFLEGLAVEGPTVCKGSDGGNAYSGFSVWDPVTEEISSTTLAPILRDCATERLVIVGLTTDYCVLESTLDAIRLGFEVIVITDAIHGVDRRPGDGERALERMREAGALLTEGSS
ncbi:MAG TPA: isochorismatase family protein [Actinomycetota bacterium]|nr:isochorismatase family protein [Actinomycetota bacterium]